MYIPICAGQKSSNDLYMAQQLEGLKSWSRPRWGLTNYKGR